MLLKASAFKMQNNKPYQKELPDKLYFKIGEVSEIAGIPAYVLRFWETEFKMINPKRTPSGQRQYTKDNVELILIIKHLLYDKKFTIEGAKRHLRYFHNTYGELTLIDTINEIRLELINIRKLLS